MRLVVRIALAVSLAALPGCPSPKTSGDFHPGIRTLARFALSGPTDLQAGVCTEGFRVGAQDGKAREVQLTDPQRVTLAPPGTAHAYRDALCTDQISALDLKAGDSGFAFWVKDDAAETITIGGSAGEFAFTTTTLNVHGRFALSGPTTGLVGACLAYHLVYKSGNGVPTTAWKDYAVALAGGGKGAFYSESSCTTAQTSLTFAKGDSDRVIYYSPTSSGPATLFAREASKVINAAAFDIVMSPTALLAVDFDSLPFAFGNVTLGATSSHTFTVRNVGGTDATSISIGALPVSFDAPSGSCLAISSLAPNGSCTLTVRHSSTSAGLHAASFAVSYTNGLRGTSFDIALTAYGVHPAPTVTAISPSAGPLAGGQLVTIDGTNFYAGVVPAIGGANCTGVTIVSATRLTCTTGAHAPGVVNVVVANTDDLIGTLTNGYRYQAAPTITLVAPASGTFAGGTAITISGTGFVSGAGVTLGGGACSGVAVVSATQITCTTPAHAAAAVNVVVTNTDVQSGTATNGFRYLSAAVLAFAPTSPYAFGSRNTGTTTSNTFTLTNSGEESATALAFTAPSAPFTVDAASTCTGLTSLPASASCTVIVKFSPVAGGAAASAEVVDYSDGGSARSLTLNVTGTGLTPASLAISEAPTYDFGAVARYASPVSHDFTVANTGGQNATGVTVGTLSAPYSVTGTTCGTTISGGGNCTVTVRFAPTSDGATSGTLNVSYATAQTASVGVAGSRKYPGFDVGTSLDASSWAPRAYPMKDGMLRTIVFQDFNTHYQGSSISKIFAVNVDGTLDTTFSSDATASGLNQFFLPLADGSGKFYLSSGGNAFSTPRPTIKRFNQDGTLDTTFNSAPSEGGNNTTVTVRALVPAAGGKILFARTVTLTLFGSDSTAILRLNSNGTIDSSFTSPAFPSSAMKVVPTTDGSNKIIVVAGLRVTRLNSDGSNDATFTAANFDSSIKQVIALPTGKVMLCGYFTTMNSAPARYLIRLTAGGALDGTFGNSLAISSVLAIAPVGDGSGNYYVAGMFNQIGAVSTALIARVSADGTPDPTFINLDFTGGQFLYLDVEASTGKVFASGNVYWNSAATGFHGVVKFNVDGTADSSFTPVPLAVMGHVVVADAASNKLTVVESESIYGAGFTDGTSVSGIVRLNADGSINAKRYTLSLPGALGAGICSPLLVARRDSENAALTSVSARSLSLSTLDPALTFYSDAGCTHTTTTATIAAGMSAVQIYFKTGAASYYEIRAMDADVTWMPGALGVSIPGGPGTTIGLQPSDAPDPMTGYEWASTCFGVRAFIADAFGNYAATGADTDITVTAPSGAQVFSDNSCSSGVSTLHLTVGATTDFWVMGGVAHSENFLMSGTGYADGTYPIVFLDEPVLTISGPMNVAAATLTTYHVDLTSALPLDWALNVNTTGGNAYVSFSPVGGNAVIPAGQTRLNFNFSESLNYPPVSIGLSVQGSRGAAGTFNVGVTSDPSATPVYDIVATPTGSASAGQCFSVDFQVTSVLNGNPTSPTSGISMPANIIMGSPGVFSDGGCTQPATSLDFASGNGFITLYFNDQTAEQFKVEFQTDSVGNAFVLDYTVSP